MPSQRTTLAAGFVLIVITTIWFTFSSTSLDRGGFVNIKDNICPPAITVLASTCETTATLLETATVVREITNTIQATTAATPVGSHPHENVEGYPLDDENPNATPTPSAASAQLDDEDLDTPSKPSTPAVSPTEEEHPLLTPTDDEDFNLTEALTKYTCYPASSKEVRQVALDTVPSINFNVVRGDNLVLSRKAKLPGHTFKTWYSVGRKPSTGCWTYHDRFGKYDDSIPRFLRSLGSVNECNADWKRALVVHLVKGQSWNLHFIHHLRSLIAEAGWIGKYHIYLLTFVDGDKSEQEAYVKEVIPEPFRPLVITFNNEDLKNSLAGEVPFEKYEGNTHVAVQMFMHDHPKYDFVYFVDSQVRLVGRWDTFLSSIDDEYAFHRELMAEGQEMALMPDLVTFEVTREPDDKWEVLEWACLQYFKGDGKDGGKIRRSLGAVGGFSRRMVDALTDVNSHKINCHSEYFAPTVAAHKDLTTFFYQHPLYTAEEQTESKGITGKVGGNDATTVQNDKVAVDFSFSGEPKDAQAFWEEWVSNEEVCRPQALLHPISGQF